MNYIAYRKGYKYQLAEDCSVDVGILAEDIETQFLNLRLGILKIKSGYAWDGPSGPTIDTKSSMRASLVHDALYQLLRSKLLTKSKQTRKKADQVFYDICIQDGMWKWRAYLWHRELRKFAASAASPKNAKKVYLAPKGKRKP